MKFIFNISPFFAISLLGILLLTFLKWFSTFLWFKGVMKSDVVHMESLDFLCTLLCRKTAYQSLKFEVSFCLFLEYLSRTKYLISQAISTLFNTPKFNIHCHLLKWKFKQIIFTVSAIEPSQIRLASPF